MRERGRTEERREVREGKSPHRRRSAAAEVPNPPRAHLCFFVFVFAGIFFFDPQSLNYLDCLGFSERDFWGPDSLLGKFVIETWDCIKQFYAS
ncbi:hypothetical protein SDJN03_05465, partial [Cucurbita argyrosperma subsp. sororia]